MNKFNLIVIIGTTGTGKSLLASHYIACYPKARLVDSIKLYEASSAVVSAFLSTDNTAGLAECDTLIIDEIPASPCLDTLSDILAYRIGQEKNTIILSQDKRNVEKLIDFEKVGCCDGTLLLLTKDADLELLCSYLSIMQGIRSDRFLELNLWKWREQSNCGFDEQEQNLSICPEQWNELLNNYSFWQLLRQSDLQCLVMSEASENMENGTVDWAIAEKYLKALIQDVRLPQRLRDTFSEVLLWVDSEHKDSYQLGINFISSHQPK